MRIISLKLVGYKRLLTNDIRTFEIRPKEMIQLILGTNGSGKSSVVAELSPLPADKKYYFKDGMKVITIAKAGMVYTLTSTFDPKPTHSLIQQFPNGEQKELNDGGTTAMQFKLVEEIFHITPQVHGLMRGVEKFSAMSSPRRREWFTQLAVADYDFAMKAYDTIRKRFNEASGALRRNSANLVVETAKIISKEEEDRLGVEVQTLLAELEILMAERMPLEYAVDNYAERRDRTLTELQEVSMRLLRLKVIAPLAYTDGQMQRDEWGELVRTTYQSIEELETAIDGLKHRTTAVETEIHHTTSLYTKQQKNYDILLKAGIDGVASLTKQHHALDVERLTLLNRRKLMLDSDDPIGAMKSFERFITPMQTLLTDLPLNTDRRYGRENWRKLQDAVIALENKKHDDQHAYNLLKAELDHANNHRTSGKTTCPECNHSWVAGINETQYQISRKKLGEMGQGLIELDKKLAEHREEIKEIEAYFVSYKEFMALTKAVPDLEKYWSHFFNTGLLTDSPKEASSLLNVFMRDLELEVQAVALLTKMDEISKLRTAAEQVGDASIQDVKEDIDLLTTKLGMLTAQVTRLRQSISDFGEYRRQLINGENLATTVKKLYSEAVHLQDGYIEALRRESIIHCIGQIQQTLVIKQESLRHAQTQKAIVAKLEEHVKELSVETEATKLMVEALSPKNGLIAEGLLGFIKTFTGQMNTLIKKIWTYPLRIVPTGYSTTSDEQSADLDYKFKMIVGDHKNSVDDVELGSTGIREVVDLAFKVTAIHYLRLSDAPLFLDEFGHSLDDAHRVSATNTIKSLMDNYNHTQLFMISHYEDNFGAFVNAERCILDARNLILRANVEYNKHVTISN